MDHVTLWEQNVIAKTRDFVLHPNTPTLRDEKWTHQPCAQKTMPELETSGGPRIEGGRASIMKPTYPRLIHKPTKKGSLKPHRGNPTLNFYNKYKNKFDH
jgi:hypothetical protein